MFGGSWHKVCGNVHNASLQEGGVRVRYAPKNHIILGHADLSSITEFLGKFFASGWHEPRNISRPITSAPDMSGTSKESLSKMEGKSFLIAFHIFVISCEPYEPTL